MKGTPAFVRITVSVACALLITTPASPADAGKTSMAQTARAAAAAYFHRHLPTAPGQFRNCVGVPPPNPGYGNRSVLRCDDSRLGLPAVIYLLNPSADNLADRVGHACEAVGLAGSPGCGERLAKHIIGQNGGQFPVAGQVIETGAEMHKGGDNIPKYEEFRDGVTVKTSVRLTGSRAPASTEDLERSVTAPVIAVYTYGRIAGGSADDYRKSGKALQGGQVLSSGVSDAWLVTVRENEKTAQDTGDDDLLTGVARGLYNREGH